MRSGVIAQPVGVRGQSAEIKSTVNTNKNMQGDA